MSLKVILVDDEERVRRSIRHFISIYSPGTEIVSEAENISQAYTEIEKHKPDVVLLDVQMPGGTGFDLLRKWNTPPFHVIFITGHDHFAVQAFRFSALDFLLKPVNHDDLITALKKVENLHEKRETEAMIKIFMSNLADLRPKHKRIILKTQDTVHVVVVGEIIRCEADKNYTIFHLTQGRKILVSKSIKIYDELLCSSGFFRVHHSHLVNSDFIERFEKNRDLVLMSDKSEVPVATRKRDQLIEYLSTI